MKFSYSWSGLIQPREALKKPVLTKTTFCEEGRSIRGINHSNRPDLATFRAGRSIRGINYSNRRDLATFCEEGRSIRVINYSNRPDLLPECFAPTGYISCFFCQILRLAQLPSWLLAISISLLMISPAWSQTKPETKPETKPSPGANDLDLSPEIMENSPVLQRWKREVPNVLEDIRNDPSFRTRLRLGYSQFPSTGQAAGFNVGVEDVFIGRTGLTVSGDYQGSFNGNRKAYGADLRYYVLPLGSYVNIAPVVGYRNLETDKYSTDGVNVGARLMLALSRTGAADISLTQTFVSPGSSEEVGLTTLSVGYAVTRNLRLSTDIQKQNSTQRKDSRVGIVLEWMP